METTPSNASASRAKTLGTVALLLKLALMVLILITIGVAFYAVFLSIGGRQIRGFKEDKEKLQKKYPRSSVEWSQADEDTVFPENSGTVTAFVPLVIILISSVLQCVVSFCYKGRTTAFKVILFGDVFLCVVGFVLFVCAGVMLIYGSTKHCDKMETLSTNVTITRGEGKGRSGGARDVISSSSFGDESESSLFEPKESGTEGAPPEDLVLRSVTVVYDIPGYPNYLSGPKTVSEIRQYKEECRTRWGTAAKIAAGVIGILAGFVFGAVAALAVMQATAKYPPPQNAVGFQQGAYASPMVSTSPSYAAASPPPPYYQQGYVGTPQSTLSYESATLSQYQLQQGPQGAPGYGPAQPQLQEYRPEEPPQPEPQQAPPQPQQAPPQPQQAPPQPQPAPPQPQQSLQPKGPPPKPKGPAPQNQQGSQPDGRKSSGQAGAPPKKETVPAKIVRYAKKLSFQK